MTISIFLMSGNCRPHSAVKFSRVGILNFRGFSYHKNLRKIFSILLKDSSLGLGRDSRMWIILEIIKVLIIVIFPIKVKFLNLQIEFNFFISKIFGSKFNSVMFFSSTILKFIPNDVNSEVHMRFKSWQMFILPSPTNPNLIAFFLHLFLSLKY